jgi:hypothetical protein
MQGYVRATSVCMYVPSGSALPIRHIMTAKSLRRVGEFTRSSVMLSSRRSTSALRPLFYRMQMTQVTCTHALLR